MNKFAKFIFASAALLAVFVSCQKVEEISEAPKTTHIVRFTTEMPTKTSYVVDKNNKVKYSWEDADKDSLKVFEDGENEGKIESFNISDAGVLSLEVSFTDSQEGPHTYTAYLNGAVKSEQVETSTGSYDPTCDVLVAKPVTEPDQNGAYPFCFRRPVAITELKLKGLKAGETVSKVTIISDSKHPIAGKYTQNSTDDSKGDWSESSNKIVVTFSEAKTVDDKGVLDLKIVTCPIKEASVKVLVETESGLKYRKVTEPKLTLLADVVKAQGIGMTQVTETEHAEDGWYLVTDASELFDGDEIRIASPAKGMIAGEFAVDSEKGTQDYLAAYAATFTPETYDEITGVDSENKPNTFTLVENHGSFALVNENGKLGTTAVKKMSYDDGLTEYAGVTEWTIAIADNLATISTGNDHGRILYNHNSGTNSRFLNYTSNTSVSMLLPQIYKKYGDPEDPIIKTARTASFSSETATVTIDANGNVFPELLFEPAEATEGARTWTSSNTEVATVDNEGNVTLLTDGTTTISVEIAATDTYQPCNASYELTVKPAEVAGVDYLDRDWTGVSDGATSYSSWTDKKGSKSGNTYAGNSAGSNNSIQLRSKNSNSGIVVTNSDSKKVARKITIDWESNTQKGNKLDIYGKSTAYTNASDLYSNDTQGTKLGSIVCGTSTELEITGDYEFIGIRSNNNALYLNWIKIQWEDPKPEYDLNFWNAIAEAPITGDINVTAGDVISYIKLRNGETIVAASNYVSSNTDVAEVDADGEVTLKKKGDAVITATLNGDDTHRTTKISYTLHVANVLSSIKLAEDSEQPTTFYVGQDFGFAGIKLDAEYNDGEKKTLTADDLTAENFSGFDSRAATESQTITVSYTDGATAITTYNVEIKPLVTLYGITVPAEDANGNSITVKGGLVEAAEGDEIELDVNLNTGKGYKLISLKVNEVEHSSDVAEGKYTFNMPAEAVTVTAEFDNHYTVTLTQPAANGTVKVKGETTSPQSIACGETVSVLAVPETGYELDSWTVEGATLTDATKASTTFTMPANDVTITTSFKEHIETQKITLTAANVTDFGSSYEEYAWSANGVTGNMWAYRGGSSGSYNMQFNKTTYVKNTTAVPGRIKSITMTKVSGNNRTWSVYVGSSALTSTTGATQVESAKEVSTETKWTVTSGDYYYFYLTKADGGTNIGSIVIEYEPGDVPEPTTYNVSVASGITGGTVTASPTSAAAGTEITLTATPSNGYSFSSWDVKDESSQAVTVTNNKFMMPASNVTVSATFTETGGGGGTDPKEYTYTFTSNSWADATSSWTSGKDGNGYTANQGVQITSGATGANATSNSSFTNVSKIVVNYCTNTSKGKGTIKVKVGNGTEKSYSVSAPSSGGTTLRNTDDFVFSTPESGVVNITVECGTNSIYINSITITAN